MVELSLDRYVEQTRVEGERIVAALDVDPSAAVPSCPGWTVTDLVRHCASIWANFAKVIARASTEAPTAPGPEAPTDADELSSWALASLDDLLTALNAMDAAQVIWTFAGVQPAAFYPRRMALENAVHRWDAEQAIGGDVTPIDSDLATDGIDEFWAVHANRNLGRKEAEDHPTGTFHLHRTDGDGEWMAEIVDGAVETRHEHGKGDAAVRGSAHDLYLYIWGRGSGDSIEIFGDEAVAAMWAGIPV